MSRGIGPVLLTHFTPDETEMIGEDEATKEPTAEQPAVREPGVLVAPAPTSRTARHRAGRGRRALVLTKPQPDAPETETVRTTAPLPVVTTSRFARYLPPVSPKRLRLIALASGAVVLIGFGIGLANASDVLTGHPMPAATAPAGMQPGTLPDAALAGIPTTTQAPPPPPVSSTPTQAAPPPTTQPSHHGHHTQPPTTQPTHQRGSGNLPQPGQPCDQPGQFTFDSNYHPVACTGSQSGGYTWQEF